MFGKDSGRDSGLHSLESARVKSPGTLLAYLGKGSGNDHREHNGGLGVDLRDQPIHCAYAPRSSMLTFTLSPSALILPQLTASSGRAPASLPSNS